MLTRNGGEEFDYVVVGGGSAGCVVAGRLAQGGAEVLVLEAGGTNRRPEVALPVGLPIAYKKHNWHYPVDPDPSRGGVIEKWPAGRVLGGGGSINAGVFVRGNRADYDGWAEQGAQGWDYEAVLPSFRRLESWEGGADAYRGGGGPIGVRRHRVPHISNEAFVAAAQEAGHPFTSDYNGAIQDGVGVCQVNQRGHFRSQSAREYLQSGLAPADRLDVRTNAVVERIVFHGERAAAVAFRQDGELRTVGARREIVLAAGAIGTPKLLLLSGVGPAGDLRKLGIDVVSDLSGVGRGLQEHAGVFLHFEALVGNLNTIGPVDVVRGLGTYLRSGGGFLASTMGQAQVMHRTDPDLVAPDIQMIFANFGTVRDNDANGDVKVSIPRQGSFLISMFFLRPTSRGTVSLRSTVADDPPRIAYEFFANEADLQAMMTGLHAVRSVMSQPALRGIAGGLWGSESGNRTPEEWEAWMRTNAHGGAHPVGTARVGTDPESVVGPDLRVHGVEGLRVADASIMPTITTGNTNGPAMMIGERAAELIQGPSTGAEDPVEQAGNRRG